ncbi:sugar transferase [Microlunatus spumicola]|uniref:Sugar transferase n=1 Tax=Microlunatus spumicola TaxID=81499 RepID=A0ABP6Y2Z9_9ACTN
MTLLAEQNSSLALQHRAAHTVEAWSAGSAVVQQGPAGVSAVIKRGIDIVGSLVGLFLLAPLLLAVALLVKVTDPAGPVLYRQQRVGRGGRAVGVLKFRSMRWQYSTGPTRPYATAEQAFLAMGRPDLVAEFALEQKVADDPRVSRLGHFLRATSLDELPQLVNALLGHLSLVGPRPIVTAELERYGTDAVSYLAVRPGITGLWQVSGRSDTSYDTRVGLDRHYVQQWRLTMDLAILVRTVGTVMARDGAR